jgi:hypothetical protein
MAKPIQRLNYHTGLFLEEEEFKLEQDYHLLMRQRLNYALFEPGVLYGMELDYSGGVLKVTPGMAVDTTVDPDHGLLGREIMLIQDSDPVDLGGFNNGETAWITIEYDSSLDVPKQPTNIESRYTQKAKIVPLNSDPGEGTDKILLGSIEVGTDSHTEPVQKAVLRLSGAPSPVELISIAVEPPSLTIEVGAPPEQLIAWGTFSVGSPRALTAAEDGLTWKSNKPSKATVDANGFVTGIAKTTTDVTITAEAQGLSATASVTVVEEAVTLESIEITPDPVPEIHVGDPPKQLIATGTFSVGPPRQLFPADGLTWDSDTPAVASIDPSTGLVTGVAPGSATITAAVGSVTDTVEVEVQPPAAQPVIDFLSPDRQISGGTIEIHGTNIRDSSLSPTDPATGTNIQFVKAADAKPGLNPIVRPDTAGRQVVRVTVPDRSGTPWEPKEDVDLQLEFNGLIATAPFRYDD